MAAKPKLIKQQDRPVHPDLRRLTKSMQSVLVRRYPDPADRKVAVQKIIRTVEGK
jgi:hypothetical protein